MREALARLSDCSKDLALRLLRCLSLCQDQDLDFMDNIFLGMLMEGMEGHVENCTTLLRYLNQDVPSCFCIVTEPVFRCIGPCRK